MDEVQVKVKPEMVTVYIMGQAYQVPAGLTILKAWNMRDSGWCGV